MERPSQDIDLGGGDNSFNNLYITGKLNYAFEKDDITFNSITVNNDAIFTGDITLDEITARNANVTGVATVGTNLYVNGKLFDGDGDFGTSGQLLSSDGTDLRWINASTTSVANANNVGTNSNSTNASQFITFVENSSGNNPIRINSNLKYNPSTNTLNQINIAGSSTAVNLNVTGNLEIGGQLKDGDGNFGSAGQLLSSDGTNTAWINTGSLTAGAAADVGVSAATANANHFITMVDTASGNEKIRVDTDLTYNPVTNTLNVPNISGNGSGLSGIESFVTGMIILWSGSVGSIPSGFVLCNGSNGTPDLRNRFVVGAGDSYSVGNSGGSNDVTLSTSQLPSYGHSFSGSSHNHSSGGLSGSTNNQGSHAHTLQIANGSDANDSDDRRLKTIFQSQQATFSGAVNSNGGHTHSISISGNTGNQSIGGSIGNTGSGASIENRPPYYALCYIMKT